MRCTSTTLNTSLTYPHLFLFLTAQLLQNSFLQQQENVCLRHLISRVSTRQHFLHPILNTATSHLSSQTHLPSVTMTSEWPSVAGETNPLKSAHDGPYINHPGEELASTRPSLFPGCPATYLEG